MLVLVNGGLFVLGLGSISFGPGGSSAGGSAVTLAVPNDSFVPLQGKILTQFYDSTGSLVGNDTAPFDLLPRTVNPVTIDLNMPSQVQGNIVIKMTFDIGVLGYYVPISAGSVTLPGSLG